MGRYIIRTGSTGLGSIRLTSPRITGHRHLNVRSPSAAAAAVLFRNIPSPPQHSLAGVGVSASAPVRNDAHVVSPASDVTQSVADPPPPLPGMPGINVPGGVVCDDLPHGGGSEPPVGGDSGRAGTDDGGDGFGGAARGDGLAPGNPGKRWRLPGKPGKRRTRASDETKAAAFLLGLIASDGVAITEATTTSKTTAARLDAGDAIIFFFA
uniref:Uncharacterized protein n=1 Tax=Oryza meridionalis TaxID=40149 RepID=A0A0E0F1S4_9ORYZ